MKLDIEIVKYLLEKGRNDFDIIPLCCKLLEKFDEATQYFLSPCYLYELCKNNFIHSLHTSREIYMKHAKPLMTICY